MKKIFSVLLAVVIAMTSILTFIPIIEVKAEAEFQQQNILQIKASSSKKYISGDWYSYKANENENYKTVSYAGCGIVALVSSIYNLGGTIDKSEISNVIKEVIDWAAKNGHWKDLSYWSLFAASDEQFGDKYGFDILETKSTYGCYGSIGKINTSLDKLVEHLKNGGTAIVHVNNHFMAAVNYRLHNEEIQLLIFDPAASTNSRRGTYTDKEGTWISLNILEEGSIENYLNHDNYKNKVSQENIEIDGYWLVSATDGSTTPTPTPTADGTNPDNYPELDRDLVYTSGSTVKTGNDVKWLQCILLHLGYSIDVDGSYGPASRDTVKKFQSAYALTVDGMAGPNTRAKLKEVWSSKGHTWNSGAVVTAATHTTTGVKTYKCNYCEETKNETIAKLSGHTYGTWQNHNSTQHKKTCACGDIQYENHTWNSGTVTKQPSCTATGVKTYTCTGCNATKTETIAAKGHNYGSWSNYNTTQHKRTCTCGNSETANHTWNSETVTKAATHTEQGVKTYTCTGCNTTKTESIAKLSNHTYGSWQNYNTTQHKRTCTCGNSETANHTWNSGTVTKATTHIEQGVKIYTCTGCGATKTENIPTISEHSYGEWTKYDKNQHKRICACGSYELSNHDWDEGVIIENPSCVAAGLIIYTCGTCSETKKVSIDCINHNYTEHHSDPTCTEQGYTTYICDCGYTYIDNYVDALGHNYKSNVTNPTCTLQGYTTYACNCGDTYTDDYVDSLGHDLSYYEGKEPTEVDDGWKSYEACSRCDYTTFEKVPALGTNNIGDESQNTIDLNNIMEMIWNTIIYLLNLIMQLLAYK